MRRKDYSYEGLRQMQLERYATGKDSGSQIVDNNPDHNVFSYDTLKKVKMPLIVDQIGKPAWTLEQVLAAMDDKIRMLARLWSRSRAFFQMSDAVSLGQQAVLDALHTDKGLAWFAGHAYEHIRAAMRRGAKSKRIIPSKQNQYSDGVRSLDDLVGEGDKNTLGGLVSDSTPLFELANCGDWWVVSNGRRKAVRKHAPGSKFQATCKRSPDGVYRTEDGEVCDRCGGVGKIKVLVERHAHSSDPVDKSIHSEAESFKMLAMSHVKDKLFHGLTEKQLEILYMRYGIGYPEPMEPSEIVKVLFQKYGMGSKNRVTQQLTKALEKIQFNAQNPGVANDVALVLDGGEL